MFGCWGIRRKAIKTFCCLTNHEYCNFFDINMDAVSLYDREWMIFSTQVDREQRVLFLALGTFIKKVFLALLYANIIKQTLVLPTLIRQILKTYQGLNL